MEIEIDPSLREAEAARTLGLAPTTLAHLRMNGHGPPFVKIGRAVRYPQKQLLAWRDSRLRTSTSEEQRVAI